MVLNLPLDALWLPVLVLEKYRSSPLPPDRLLPSLRQAGFLAPFR